MTVNTPDFNVDPTPADPSDPTTTDNTPVGAPAPGMTATPGEVTTDPAPANVDADAAAAANADAAPAAEVYPTPVNDAAVQDGDPNRFNDEPPHAKTVSQVAHEVLNGAWGNGNDRRDKLARAGYDYEAVQAEVNAIARGEVEVGRKSLDQLSDEVIAGNWGNGAERERRLIEAGYSAQAVQVEVNRKLAEKSDSNPA